MVCSPQVVSACREILAGQSRSGDGGRQKETHLVRGNSRGSSHIVRKHPRQVRMQNVQPCVFGMTELLVIV